MGAEYRTKYSENIYDRNWGKNGAMFISNLVRASIFNEFELVKQGFSPTASFDVSFPHALVGVNVNGQDYFAYKEGVRDQQIKYKAKDAMKEIVTFLKRKKIVDKSNYKTLRTKVFILFEQNTGTDFLEIINGGAINFLEKNEDKQLNSRLFTYDYYESICVNNIVHCYAKLH
jgi:hypothetical protein